MTFDEFKTSLTQETPPTGINPLLQALWETAKGHWDRAHKIAQTIPDANGSLVHAYLHRQEGDLANALYWYHNAGQNQPHLSLEEEWEHLVKTLLTCTSNL